MGLTTVQEHALKILPPSVLSEPNFDLFEFLHSHKVDFKDTQVIKMQEIVDSFTEHVIEHSEKKQFKNKKKQLEQVFDDLGKKLNTILWNYDPKNEIVQINWELLSDFYDLLKHIKRADERKIQWAIYHLFSQGQRKIPIESVKNIISDVKITNFEKLLNKVITEAKKDGMKIDLLDSQIVITNKLDNKEDAKTVKLCLADKLEFYSRSPRRSLESDMLDLLDQGSYSNQEISAILEVDKSPVSKAMKKLLKSDEIKWSSAGTRGSHYYTTNCLNCPFGTTLESCRKESVSFIISSLKNDFGLDLKEKDFEQIEENQTLMHVKNTLREAKKEKNTKIESSIIYTLNRIYGTVFVKTMTSENLKLKKTPYVSLSPILEKMPILYLIGFQQGQASGANLVDVIMRQVLEPYLNKKQYKEVIDRIFQEVNKIKSDMSSK